MSKSEHSRRAGFAIATHRARSTPAGAARSTLAGTARPILGGVACSTLLGIACLLAATAPAAADRYHDFLCQIPYGPSAGRAAPVDDVGYSIDGTYSEGYSSCTGPSGAMVTRMDGAVTHSADGEGEYARFTAPSGLTIAGFTLWRYEQIGNTEPYGPPVASIDYGNASSQTAIDVCAWIDGCSANGTQSAPLSAANEVSAGDLSGMTYIEWSAVCAATGGTCPTGPNTEEDVYAADIDLEDNTPPTVDDITGPLVDGGTLSGQQTIAFQAADGQSGVYAGTLLVDGRAAVSQILDTNGGACQSLGVTGDGQRSFEHAQPCKPSLSASLTLDTGELTPGQHSLELIVEDAAGNQTIGYDGTIVTAGPPLVGVNGGTISAGRGTPNGEPCAGEILELAVNGSPVNGSSQFPIVAYGKPVTVRGVLHCGTTPVRNARVAVTTVGGPASAAIDTTIQTALDGSFEYHVPTGPDRTLNFSYTAYSNDTAPSATATATISIRPQIKLRIAPRRTRNGHTIHWTGTIAGGPYPRHGVTLEVEVKEGRHWKVFDQVVANNRGQFHYSYRFHATTEPVTYTFRVAMPDTGARSYPYASGASNTVKVRVNP